MGKEFNLFAGDVGIDTIEHSFEVRKIVGVVVSTYESCIIFGAGLGRMGWSWGRRDSISFY